MAKSRSTPQAKRRTFFREWRKYRNLTLEGLAEMIGVTAGALSQLERGQVNYTQPMLENLAKALECQPADLILRDPRHELTINPLWSQIPDDEKPRALDVLKAFVPK